MFFLRVMAFFAGSFVAFAAPFLMLTERQGMAMGGMATILLGAVCVLGFGLAYFYFALLGHNIVRSHRMRRIAGAMVVFQLVAGGWLIHASSNARVLVTAAPLMCFSVLLFLAFVWPGDSSRNHRPMRRREHSDQVQSR
ncbi:hypothetical protein SAMN05428948_3656 [Massilia sp. CF038]|nr:hypothetical protein SAMN05428948_3656 [Massilia sp. CF038]